MEQVQENQATETKTNPEILSQDATATLQNDSQIDLEQDEPQAAYDAENPELDALLDDATITQAEIADEKREQKQAERLAQEQQNLEMKPEQAAELAVKGIIGTVQFAREQTGVDLKISQAQLQIGAAVFTPVIMKYAPVVQKYIDNAMSGVDDESYVPEYLAAGGAVGLGALMYWQYNKAKKQPRKTEVVNDGD